MLKRTHFGHARADEPCASCGTRSTSRAASSRSVRRGAVVVRREGGQAVLTGPGPERLHNLSGGEHDLTPEHWQLLRSPISATFLLPTADFVAGAARSRHERRVSGDPCKPRMIMMLERCPEEGSRIDWAAGAPRPIAATCCQLKINPVSKNNFTKSVLAPT